MRLDFSAYTVAKGGGFHFYENLRYFDNYVKRVVQESEFKSFFDVFEIEFYYPPIYKYFKSGTSDIYFWNNYEKYPTSKIYRRYRKIVVKLPAPEFSEHFELKNKFEDRIPIEKIIVDAQYRDLDNVVLAKILLNKIREAIEIITPKLTEVDNFDTASLLTIIKSIKPKISIDFLNEMCINEKIRIETETLSAALRYREQRKFFNKENDTLIRDLRVYHSSFPIKAFYPYDYQYTEIFLNVLSRKGLKCPGYHHIYIEVAKTKERALGLSGGSDWFAYASSSIDYESYLKKNETEKATAVFNFICEGLYDIAELDKLDVGLIKEAIEEIKLKRLDTELIYKVKEHKDYHLTITFLAKNMEEKCPVYFIVEDKKTLKKYKIQIGKADKDQIWLWLQKITLTKKKIKIKSSVSIKANVTLKRLKRQMEFELSKIMVAKNRL